MADDTGMGLFRASDEPKWAPVVVRPRPPIEQWRGRATTGDRSFGPKVWAAVIVGVILLASVSRSGGMQALRDTSPTVALVIAGFAVFAVVVFTLALRETPPGGIEWDGERVVWRLRRGSREIAVARAGSVVRVRLTGAASKGLQQLWLAPDGSIRADLPESMWDGEALLRIAAAAHIPVTDLGTMTPEEFLVRYPSVMPRIGGMAADTPVTLDVLKTVVRNEIRGGDGRKPLRRDPHVWAIGAMVVITIVWKFGVGH